LQQTSIYRKYIIIFHPLTFHHKPTAENPKLRSPLQIPLNNLPILKNFKKKLQINNNLSTKEFKIKKFYSANTYNYSSKNSFQTIITQA